MNRSPYPTMRDRFDLRAYFVVGPDDTKGRPVADVVAAALRGGATFIQLRAKHADARELTAMAEAIAAVIAQAGKADTVAFVIDDRVDAAWQCRELGIKVDGVHIGQDDMAPEQARALLGPDAVFSPVMSWTGRAVLLAAGVATSYDTLVPHIQNRTKSGQCPMDSSVTNVWEPYEAVGVLSDRVSALRSSAQVA